MGNEKKQNCTWAFVPCFSYKKSKHVGAFQAWSEILVILEERVLHRVYTKLCSHAFLWCCTSLIKRAGMGSFREKVHMKEFIQELLENVHRIKMERIRYKYTNQLRQ